VRIYTFGLSNYDNELVDAFCGDYGQAWVSEPDLRKAFERHRIYNVNIFSDVRDFGDPQSGSLRGHIGVHPEILQRFLASGVWSKWIYELKARVNEELKGADDIGVAFYCKAGKHRSVAGARFLEHFVKRMGCDCVVEHLCKKDWKSTCKGNCEECKEDSQSEKRLIREHTLERAALQWEKA